MTSFITMNQLDALNQQTENNVKNIFKDDNSYLESDVDEQLIISVPFNQRKCYLLKATTVCLKAEMCSCQNSFIKVQGSQCRTSTQDDKIICQ